MYLYIYVYIYIYIFNSDRDRPFMTLKAQRAKKTEAPRHGSARFQATDPSVFAPRIPRPPKDPKP